MAQNCANFCCRSGGSNLNAGTTIGANTEEPTTAAHTYSGGSWSGPTFTVASGNPLADGVQVDQWAALNDGGAAAVYLSRVTGVTSTTITLSSTWDAPSTIPVAGTYELRIGGAWQGPNGSDTFPFSIWDRQIIGSGDGDTQVAVVNFKNDQTYSVTATLNGITWFKGQGYTSTYGDGGKATIQGPSTGASFTLCRDVYYMVDFIFDSNGDTGTAAGVIGTYSSFYRCTFRNMVANGVWFAGSSQCVECEAYSNGNSGFYSSSNGGNFYRCIARDNGGDGIHNTNASTYAVVGCVAAGNVGSGIYYRGRCGFISQNTCYENGGDGIRIQINNPGPLALESCFVAKNAGYGIAFVGVVGGRYDGFVYWNNRYGVGSEANVAGDTYAAHKNLIQYDNAALSAGTVSMEDPANGDFRKIAEALQQTGRGGYTQEEPGQSGMVGFPDIGAGQSYIAGGGMIRSGMSGGFNG